MHRAGQNTRMFEWCTLNNAVKCHATGLCGKDLRVRRLQTRVTPPSAVQIMFTCHATTRRPHPRSCHGPGSGSGGKMRKHGVAVFGQAPLLPRGTYHGPHVAKGCPTGQHTPRKDTWNYCYTHTLPPIWTVPAACTKATTHSLCWIGNAKTMVPKTCPKVR